MGTREVDAGAGEVGEEGEPLLVERRGAVLLLTLNRPRRLNAVNLALYRALRTALEGAAAEASLRAVVLTGAGRAFSVGADLKRHGEGRLPPADLRRYIRAAQAAARAVQRSPLPVVAAVNGHAVGAGLELALSADLVVVAHEAKLRFPEVALGTFVGGGVTRTLPARVGMARAKELLLRARFFTPDEAVQMGLANEVLPAAGVPGRAMELAEELASHAPIPMRLARELLASGASGSMGRVLAREAEALRRCMESEDWAEGVEAFHEKRPPRYGGR